MNEFSAISDPSASLGGMEDGASGSDGKKKWHVGYGWKDDKLYHFTKNSVTVMRMWPEMRAWRRTITKPWVHTRRYADEAISYLSMEPGRVERWNQLVNESGGPLPETHQWHTRSASTVRKFAAAFATIPDLERKIASTFRERRWHVLALMARCPGASDLLQSNPALGFALASNWVLHTPAVTQPMRSARALVYKPQQAILNWLGFPATERVRKILKKIEPCALEIKYLPQIRFALHDPKVQDLLAHVPLISAQALRFSIYPQYRERVTAKFIHEIAEATKGQDSKYLHFSHITDYVSLWHDSLRMFELSEKDFPKKITGLKNLRKAHDDMVLEFNAVNNRNHVSVNKLGDIKLPDPPFPGDENIIPLTTTQSIWDEGREMHHCIASYISSVAQGDFYIYKVIYPVRATLAIKKNSYGHWDLQEMSGLCNALISSEIKNQVWMDLSFW